MDPREYLNDNEEASRLMLDGRQAGIWTSMPGIVISSDLAKQTCVVQLAIQGRYEDQLGGINWVNIGVLHDVPIVWPSFGGFTITGPLPANSEVLISFASRCIDSWWQNGGYANKPMEFRMHDLSDGFAIPGPKSLPNVLTGVNTTDLQIRNNAGTVYLSIGADGKIGFTNVATSLKSVLSDFESAVNTFMGVLAGFAGGGAPVTQAMLQAPAIAAQASLATVLIEIGALLK